MWVLARNLALLTVLGSACLLASLALGCRTAPVTQRSQFMLVPESQEVALGASAYQELLTEQPASANTRYGELVQRIGQRIAAVAERPNYAWEFRVLASPEKNAFCLPGGKVGVYEGMIEFCENEGELAVIMSHEVAHALQRHGGERMSQGFVAQAVENALKYATQDRDKIVQQRILTAYGLASEYGALLPFSRKHELEADHVGMILMARAGYDPSAAPRLWERFSQASGPKPPEFLSTHPSDLRRAGDLQRLLPEALAAYETAPARVGVGERIVVAANPVPQAAQ